MTNPLDCSTPVVVLGLETHGSIGIMRTLGRMGVPVYGIDPDRDAAAFLSKYCRAKFIWDIAAAPAQQTVDFLSDVAHRIGCRPLLIPTADEGAVFVAENAAALRDSFIFPEPGEELVKSLISKKTMYFLAKRHGIPTAETAFPQSRNDVIEFMRAAVFPIMLKGIDGNLLKRRTGTKMEIVSNADELLAKYDELEDPLAPNLMLQEYIPGGEDTIWMFNGYFNEQSDCPAAFTGQKIRQSPVYTGATSLGICVKNAVVEETTKTFMKALGYKGILDIGYRYDARDGKYKVLDINPRIGATFRLFLDERGMDVARVLYLDQTGQPVPQLTPIDGRKWIVEFNDLRSCLEYRKDGVLTLGEWIKSYRGVQEGAFFALDDPRPFLKELADAISRNFGKALHLGGSRFEPARAPQPATAKAVSSAEPPQVNETFQ
jgi:predicted ATP-grasp superfamily ATP-dependent carboligase